MIKRNRICTDVEEFETSRVVTFINPYSLLKILESGIDLHRFDRICIDGTALNVFFKFVFRDRTIQRLSFDFTSVANIVFQQAAENSQSGFVLGSDNQSNYKFLSRISQMFPGIRLSGQSGYFDTENELDEKLRALAASDFDFIVVGMGAVKQESVINSLVDYGFKGRLYSCGGFIHQTAMNNGEYYPKWIDSLNLRFAYRMFKEPKTIKRYLIDYPRAMYFLTRNVRQLSL